MTTNSIARPISGRRLNRSVRWWSAPPSPVRGPRSWPTSSGL